MKCFCFPVALVTGAALHIHSSALVGVDWLVKNVTYRPHCYICFTWDSSVRFLFSEGQPLPRWDCFYWQLLETLRARIGDPTEFDNRFGRTPTLPGPGRVQSIKSAGVFFPSLMQHLTLLTEDPEGEYSSQEVVWQRFEKAFMAAAGLISHAPVLRDYLYRGLSELRLDNIMYLELRSGLSKVLMVLVSSALMV